MKKICFCLALVVSTTVLADEENSIVNMAKENGVKTCVPQLKIAADFIIDEKAHSSHAYWNKKDADNRMYSSLTSKGYSDGDSHVTVAVAQTSSGKCDTFYVETYALPKACMMAREETFKGFKYKGTMNGKTLLLENESGAVNLYLTPQGESICLVSKREALYQ
ncbi:hypothetical protein [Photobacterium lipolyticum]|uniref:Uncharacterized protein n=1 Tax=Photobacterium lipolyticum TaxID=266810 RepID=A0A2T3MMD9_9GAMM|nr:hypothetical protein [Photobacterium lipolyticum]PSV97419.1 hypothetical protein C9I89_22220 [Photobacterium lipolyticum]